MPRLRPVALACAALASALQAAGAFRAAPLLAATRRAGPAAAARRGAAASASSWTMDGQYKIVPSQLEGTGGGWTIQGVKPPPAQGTVWARPRPGVGEVQEMGVGSFGRIYLGTDLLSGAEVAVKAETDFGQKNSALRAEAEILISLQGGPGVPDVYWVGKRELAGQACNILVMELLGPDMEDLLEMMNRRTVSEKTGLMLAWQMIDCLEHIHSRGLIHRDIKPENFLMGVKERANKVYLIDYGLSGYFVDDKNEHLPPRKTNDPLRGTLRYASVNKHEGMEQSRRDDVEEVMYVLIYMMLGRLPWMKEEARTFDGLEKQRWARDRQLKRVFEAKKFAKPDELCRGLPDQIAEMLEYVRGLDWYDTPDYALLKSKVEEAMFERNYAMDYAFDWGNRVLPKKKVFGLF